ncbi:hypothetical protein HAHE_25700 [Haloferula helveola]|uniref:DUF1501 domain-containing protein n=1 Tax=Haloferula helveola TaxID=490095 RepID=A0ABM7REU8_9BACT|nr:hypothetical protein HAHE_25700 [Haloferula helveola]
MSIDFHSRREFLYGLGATLGTAAFNAMAEEERSGPLDPKKGHLPAKAKSCILLYLEGGPSHIDTFDPKPELSRIDGKGFKNQDKLTSGMARGDRRYVGSPFKFRQVGKGGLWMCEHFRELAGVADDLCIYRGCQGESVNHPTANLHMNTGNRLGGDPAIGSWVGYGLGSENRNLPGFVVLPGTYYPQSGAANWTNGFLPAHFQGTPLRPTGAPILDLEARGNIPRSVGRRNLDLLAELEKSHRARHPEHDDLAARMHSYELMFRMQAEVPGLLDLTGEDEKTRSMYGLDRKETQEFGRSCLLARRLVEKGVRFVQAYSSGWDSHDDLKSAHGARMAAVDRPIAALIRDLKQRGLLDETLVVILGEFGRSPDNAVSRGRVGRDHNPKAMSVVFAGGGVPAGTYVGRTDEIGGEAVEVVHPIRDLHVTLLHLLGLDDNKLTYLHGGRFKQLSQTGGNLIRELVG